MEKNVAELEGGYKALGCASGMAAISTTFTALLKSGDHVVCSKSVYGPTTTLLRTIFEKFNVETTFVETSEIEEIKFALKPNTKVIYVETPGNPTLSITDIQKVAKIAHVNEAKLVVDNGSGGEGLDLSTANSYANLRVIHNSLSSVDKDMHIGYLSGTNSSLHLYSDNVETMRLTSGGYTRVGYRMFIGDFTTDPTMAISITGGLDQSGIKFTYAAFPPGYLMAYGANGGLILSTNGRATYSGGFDGYEKDGFQHCIWMSQADGSINFCTAPYATAGSPPGEVTRMVISNTGLVGIGMAPTKNLDVNGDIRASVDVWTHDGGVHSSSDIRLKDVKSSYNRGLEEICKLEPLFFYYKKDNPLGLNSDIKNIGLIAQEVQKLIPEAVGTDDKGYLNINTNPLFYAMINSIKELKAENDRIRGDNEKLKAENQKQKAESEKKIIEIEKRLIKIEKTEEAKK